MSPVRNWDPGTPRREAMAEARRRIERAAWIVERAAKQLVSTEGTMSADQVEAHAQHVPGFARQFNAGVPFRRGKGGTTYVKLKDGKLVDRKRSPNRKHP